MKQSSSNVFVIVCQLLLPSVRKSYLKFSSFPSRMRKADNPVTVCFPFFSETECSEDMVSTTTVAPTTPKHITSQVPATSPAPTAAPSNPAVGKYNVTGANGTCVLASMGLQLNITYLKKDGKVHFSSKPSDSLEKTCQIITGYFFSIKIYDRFIHDCPLFELLSLVYAWV